MKKLIFLFILITQVLFAQDQVRLIYVDNSISIERPVELIEEISSVIENFDDSITFILGNVDAPSVYYLLKDDLNDQLQPLCLVERDNQTAQEIVLILEKELDKREVFSNGVVIKDVQIDMFFHISTFKHKKYYEKVINTFLSRNKLRNREGVDKRLNIIVHLDYLKKKSQYDDFIESIENRINRIIIKYY